MMSWRRPLADLAKLSVLLSSASDGGALSRMMVAHFGKGGASDAGGLFGHGRDRVLRAERHGEASRHYRTNAALDPPSHPFASGIGSKMGQFSRSKLPPSPLLRCHYFQEPCTRQRSLR